MKKISLFLSIIFLISLLYSCDFLNINSDDGYESGDGYDITVYITEYGNHYHVYGCQYLFGSAIRINLTEALAKGYYRCSACRPPTQYYLDHHEEIEEFWNYYTITDNSFKIVKAEGTLAKFTNLDNRIITEFESHLFTIDGYNDIHSYGHWDKMIQPTETITFNTGYYNKYTFLEIKITFEGNIEYLWENPQKEAVDNL